MTKEHKSRKDVGHWPYLAIVSIVAIVAVIFLVLNFSDGGVKDTTSAVDKEGNIVGEVGRLPELYVKRTDLGREVKQIMVNELKNTLTYDMNSMDCHSTNAGFYGSTDNKYSCEEYCGHKSEVCIGAFMGEDKVAGSGDSEVNAGSRIHLPVTCVEECYAGTDTILICQYI